MFWCGRAGKLQGTLYEITFRAYLSFKVSLCSALNECYDFLQFCCEFNVRQGTSKANHKALGTQGGCLRSGCMHGLCFKTLPVVLM